MTLSRPLAFSLLLLLATPLLAAEIPVTQPGDGRAPGDQTQPAVVANGGTFLAAWVDPRAFPLAIYASRVAADETLPDSFGIRVPVTPGAAPSLTGVFHLGGAYVLVFTEQTFVDNNQHFVTKVARISDDGVLIDGPRVVADNFNAQSAAASATRIVVTSAGKLLILDDHAQTLEVGDAFPNVAASRVVSNGTTFLVVNYLFSVSADGLGLVALDAAGHPFATGHIAGNATDVAVASDGFAYLVAFRDTVQGKTVLQAVGADATPAQSNTLPLVASPLSLAWSGDRYLLFHPSGSQLMVRGVTGAGVAIDAPHPVGDFASRSPAAAAWNGRKVLVAWTLLFRETDVDIVWQMLSGSGSGNPTAANFLSISGNPQTLPAIAAGGTNDLVVWNESYATGAARITRSGATLDSSPLLAGFAPSSLPPRAVFDGHDYVVVWSVQASFYATRIDAESGAVSAPEKLGDAVDSFDVGRDDAGVVVFSVPLGERRVVAQRLGAAGSSAISPPSIAAANVRAAWNGSEWLVVYNQAIPLNVLVPAFRGNVLAQRMSSALVPIDTTPIGVAISAEDESAPVVASNGRDFLVTWTHRFNDPGVRARTVRADGSMPAEAFALTPTAALARDVVWDGTRYAVAYALQRADGVTYELWLTHVTTAPIGDRVPISTDSPDQRNVALAPTQPLRAAYQRVATEPQYGGVSKVFVRELVPPPRRRAAK